MKINKTIKTSYEFTKKDIEELLITRVLQSVSPVNGESISVDFDIQESQEGGLAGDYIPTTLKKAVVTITNKG